MTLKRQIVKSSKANIKQTEIHQCTVRKIVYKWRAFKWVANLPGSKCPNKFSSRSDHFMLREAEKKPRVISCVLQASLSTLNVYVHVNTISKRLKKNGFDGTWKGG